MNTIFSKVLITIGHIGYLYFGILLLIDIILWKIHPVLGILGVAFTFALLMGLI
ncbi:MAG: hypothetical protein NTX85_00105 [Candidatus Nomurabacteria bacterium]|nr:hypothetical protein [Candidatus Nomurabacteria bacterium]